MITGFISRGLPANGITDTDTSPSNTDSPTFSNMNAGTVHASRRLTALVTAYDNDTDDGSVSFSNVIGGVSATNLGGAGSTAGGSETMLSIVAMAAVPTGTTASVATTMSGFSGTMDDWGCTLVATYNLEDPVGTLIDESSANLSGGNGYAEIDTTGAKIVFVAVAHDADISSRTPYSNNVGSTLVKGHHTTNGMAFIDITPPGGTVRYGLDSPGSVDPPVVYAGSVK